MFYDRYFSSTLDWAPLTDSPGPGWLPLPAYADVSDITIPDANVPATQLRHGEAYIPPEDYFYPDVPYTIARDGRIILPSKAEFAAVLNGYRSAVGTPGVLWKRAYSGIVVHMPAVYLGMGGSVSHEQVYRYGAHWALDVSLRFSALSAYWRGLWHGDGMEFDVGKMLDTGLMLDYDPAADTITLNTTTKTGTLTNQGNRPQRHVRMLITVGDTTLTKLTMESTTTGSYWEWEGSVAATRQLEIDTGRLSVEHLTSTSGASRGATTLPVATSSGAAVGSRVSVVWRPATLWTPARVWSTTIATIPDGTSVTLDEPLPRTIASGARVGFAAYDGFTWTEDEWWKLAPGDNEIVITRTGGGTAADVFYQYFSSHA